MSLGVKSNNEEAIKVFNEVAEEASSMLNYFENNLVQNEFWT